MYCPTPRRRIVLIRTLVVSVALAVAPVLQNAQPVAAAGLCLLADKANFHLVANKFAAEVSASFFDVVRGDATVRTLDVCVGTGGGTFVLPANLETASGVVLQLGYGQRAGGSLSFYYARGSQTAIVWPGYSPTVGHRYRYWISRVVEPDNSITTAYKIQDLDDGSSSSLSFSGWYAGMDHAWWGTETWDALSAHGVLAGNLNQNPSYMGYSPNNSATTYYRSGLTCSDIWKNFTWDGSSDNSGCNGSRHGHVGTWVYGGDKLAPETH